MYMARFRLNDKKRQKKERAYNNNKKHVQSKLRPINSISRFMLARNIENELFYEILELDIPTNKKDSICNKLCMLLDEFYRGENCD